MHLTGGGVRRLADVTATTGGSWAAGNVILFAPTGTGALRRIPADGGESSEVTTIKPPEQVTRVVYPGRWPTKRFRRIGPCGLSTEHP